MDTSEPDAQRANAPHGDPSGNAELRSASDAPDLGAERPLVRSKPVDDPKAKPGGETPGRESYDPQGGSNEPSNT